MEDPLCFGFKGQVVQDVWGMELSPDINRKLPQIARLVVKEIETVLKESA